MSYKHALLAFCLFTAPLARGYSQPTVEITGISLRGVPHPVSAALAYWDSLGLTETQVRQLRHISERLENRFAQAAVKIFPDSSALLHLWRSEPIDSAALAKSAHDKVATETSLVIATLRARDEVFAVLTSEQRVRLNSLVHPVAGSALRPERPTRLCTLGGIGGSSVISDQVDLVYSLDLKGDSAYVGTIFVARADEKLQSSPRRLSKPDLPGAPGFLSGGTSGRWWLQYDRREHAAWVETRRIDLGQNNVVLVQGIDRLTKDPDIAGLVRVESPFYTNGCRSAELTELIKEQVLKSARVRTFIESGR